MNSLDIDLIEWRRQWRDIADEAPAADLPGRVARELRRSLLGLIAPVLVTLIVGGGLAWRAANAGSAANVASAIGAWCFIGLAWAGSLWLGRGAWRPRNESAAAFVDLSIARCTGWIRAIPFAITLYVVELVFVLEYVGTLRNPERRFADMLVSGPAIGLGWVGLPGILAACVWWRQTLVARRCQLLSLRKQLTDG